uniref:Uncharacterized protein n=1 Tax=Arundo donax TaxID=35708 RepID=A0A0A8Z5U2_ARUDO
MKIRNIPISQILQSIFLEQHFLLGTIQINGLHTDIR